MGSGVGGLLLDRLRFIGLFVGLAHFAVAYRNSVSGSQGRDGWPYAVGNDSGPATERGLNPEGLAGLERRRQ